MCRKNRRCSSGIVPTISTAGITPGFVSARSGTAWGIAPRWRPVVRTGLSNDRNNSWSSLYERQDVVKVEVEERHHKKRSQFSYFLCKPWAEPQPQPVACCVARSGGSCGGAEIGKRNDHTHGRTTSDASSLAQHDLRGRWGERTGRSNRLGPSLTTYRVSGEEAARGKTQR